MANTASRDAALQQRRKELIDHDVKQFFNRYTSAPTAAKIIADAARFKKRLDPFAYARIIARANALTPAPAPAARRPTAAPNGSAYFNTPGAAPAAPGGGLDPLLLALGAVAVYAFLRK